MIRCVESRDKRLRDIITLQISRVFSEVAEIARVAQRRWQYTGRSYTWTEGTEIEFLLTEDVDDESLLMSLDMIECFSSSDEFEEVENELDAVLNDVSF